MKGLQNLQYVFASQNSVSETPVIAQVITKERKNADYY